MTRRGCPSALRDTRAPRLNSSVGPAHAPRDVLRERILRRGGMTSAGLRRCQRHGFNSVMVEGDRARDTVVVLTNAAKNRAERLARRIEPLVFP